MSPCTLQEFSLTPSGAIFLCLVSPQLAPGIPHLSRGYTKAKLLDPTGMVLPSCSSPSSFVVSSCLSHGFGAAKCIAGGCRHVVQAALPSLMALCLPALPGA